MPVFASQAHTHLLIETARFEMDGRAGRKEESLTLNLNRCISIYKIYFSTKEKFSMRQVSLEVEEMQFVNLTYYYKGRYLLYVYKSGLCIQEMNGKEGGGVGGFAFFPAALSYSLSDSVIIKMGNPFFFFFFFILKKSRR
jgi:hypothetical protein